MWKLYKKVFLKSLKDFGLCSVNILISQIIVLFTGTAILISVSYLTSQQYPLLIPPVASCCIRTASIFWVCSTCTDALPPVLSEDPTAVPEAHYNQGRLPSCVSAMPCAVPRLTAHPPSFLKWLICFHICPFPCIVGPWATREVFLFAAWHTVDSQ